MIVLSRRQVLAAAVGVGTPELASYEAQAQGNAAQAQAKVFRIGTGGAGGTYYRVGGVIGIVISTGNISVSAVVTNGSVANIHAIAGGALESGFSQADINNWAFTATGLYDGKPKVEDLRLIANLYPETVHVVVKKGLNVKSLADLKGRRVSLDAPGSGTLVNAKAILAAYGLTEKDFKPEYLNPKQSADRMKDGAVDAFFSTAGVPQGSVTDLAATSGIELVPIDGADRDKILAQYKFFAADKIPDGAYKDVKGVDTIAVGAQWVTSARQDADLVYAVTKALWSDKTRAMLDAGHAKGKAIVKATALNGVGIPLHPGAEKFYKEAGLLK